MTLIVSGLGVAKADPPEYLKVGDALYKICPFKDLKGKFDVIVLHVEVTLANVF